MRHSTHHRSLQALEMALRKGSLKSAAAALHITPAAVGQRIKALEDYLGFDLLVRGRSGIRPTPELERAQVHLTAAFRELDTVSEILDFQRVHEIHVLADTDWAELWLAPRLADFRGNHPYIQFCVNGVGDVPMRLGDADCEVWFGEPRGGTDEHFLFRDYLLPVSSPANDRRLAGIGGASPLEGFPLLHLECYKADPAALGWPDWVKRFGQRQSGAARGVRYRHIVHALEAVYSNAGVLLCGLAMVHPLAERGAVSLPFGFECGAWSNHAYRIAFRGNATRRDQVAEFRDWLLQEAAATTRQLTRLVQ